MTDYARGPDNPFAVPPAPTPVRSRADVRPLPVEMPDADVAAAVEDEDEELADRVRRYAARADDASRSFVARQPLAAVAAGAAVGALVGWLVKR